MITRCKMKLAQISSQHKIHAVYRKGKPTITYCTMYLWNYIASEGTFQDITCNKCQQEIQKEIKKCGSNKLVPTGI